MNTPTGGFQPLSIRVHFVRRMARSKNPILSWGAKFLLTDKTSIRLGIVYESIVIYGMLIISIVQNVMLRKLNLNDEITPETLAADGGLILWFLLVTLVMLILAVGGFVTGGLLAIRPVNALFDKKSDSGQPGLIGRPRDAVLKSLVTLALVSVGLPLAILGVLDIIANVIVYFSNSLQAENVINTIVFTTITKLLMIFFMSFGTVYAGLKYNTMKRSFWAYKLTVIILILSMLAVQVIFVSSMGEAFSIEQTHMSKFVTFPVVMVVGVFVVYLMARREVSKKLHLQNE